MKPVNRILLAEDEVDTLMGLQKTLMKEGYSVDVARDGLEAAEKVRRERFDVVVSDLKMPHIDGMELLHMTKEANRSIVFIIITGYGTVDSAVEAMRLGASDYINKPFSTEELIGAIEKALGEKPALEESKPRKKEGLTEAKRYESGHAWFSVQPDGTVSLVTGAHLNGSQRDSRLEPKALVQGEIYDISFEMHFTTWTFKPGHRIRLAVSNALFPIIPVQFPHSSDADAAIIAIFGCNSPVFTAAHRPPWERRTTG